MAAQQAMNAARPKTELPQFSGNEMSFPAFLQRFESALVLGMVPEDQWARFLAASFRGKAADTIVAVFGEEDIWAAAFADVVVQLRAIFVVVEMEHQRVERFASLRLENFPTMDAMLQRFYAEVAVNPVGLSSHWKKSRIIAVVQNFPAILVGMSAEQVMDDATSFAQFISRLQAHAQWMLEGPRVGAAATAATAAAVQVERLHALELQIVALRTASGRAQRGGGAGGGPGACFNCGKLGHYKRDCRAPPKQDGFKGSGGFKCFNCGGSGHKAAECSKSKKFYLRLPLPLPVSVGTIGSVEGVESGEATLPMHGVGSVGQGEGARILVDGGSGANVVSAQFVRQHKLTAENAPLVKFTFGNGTTAMSTQAVRQRVSLGEWTGEVVFRICPLMESVDAILGRPWLKGENPTINWATGSLVCAGDKLVLGQREKAVPVAPVAPVAVSVSVLGAASMRKELGREDSVSMQALWITTAAVGAEVPGEVGEDRVSAGLTTAERAAVRSLLEEFVEVFPAGLPKGAPLGAHGVKHDIPLEPGAIPPASRPFRLSPLEADMLSAKMAELLDQGLVRSSSSPFGAPVLLVKKKDGSFRLCIDYRRLNEITRKDKFPLPLIEDLLERLVGQHYFSKVDLTSGYYQVGLEEEAIERTAFVTPAGSFEWVAMPLGLCNAPSTFQRMMQKVMGPLLNKCVVVYLDDCLIYSKTLAEHLVHLRQVLTALKKSGLYCNLTKCSFATTRVNFCGHVVSYNEVRMEHDKVEAVRSWLPPTTVGELRTFVGFVNYYRRFLRQIGGLAAPLTALMGQGATNKPLQLTEVELRAFEAIKLAVTSEPVLRAFEPYKPVAVFADTSDEQAGSFWAQDHGHGWQPGGFESHKLSPAERNYSIRDKELLAIVQACRRWRHRLHGRKVLVFTDHESLKLLLLGKEMQEGRVARQLEFLAQFDLQVEYLPGKKQLVADALSRLPSASLEAARVPAVGVAVSLAVGVKLSQEGEESWAKELRADRYFGPVMAVLEGREVGSVQGQQRALRFQLTSGALLLFKEGNRLCVPMGRRVQLLKEHHDIPQAGHLGADKCHLAVAQLFFWPRMRKDVCKFVSSCKTCMRVKPDLRPAVVAQQPLPIPLERWDTVGMDWITGLPLTRAGFDSILTVTDVTSGRVRLLKTRATASSEETAQLFLENIFAQHGLPRKIVSDRDPKLTAAFWKELMRLLETQLGFSTAGYAQADGRAERTNQTTENVLRALVDYNQADWDLKLYAVEFAINSHVNAASGFSPFVLDLGREPLTPAALLRPATRSASAEGPAALLIDKIRSVISAARDRLAIVQADGVARGLGNRVLSEQFAVGDQVLVARAAIRDPNSADAGVPKLSSRFVGPFKVVQVMGPATYRLLLPARIRCHPVFNVSKLKPFIPNEFEGREVEEPGAVGLDKQGHDIFEVERVVDKKYLRGKLWYLVEWTGYTEPSWEPAAALKAPRVLDIIKSFEERYQPARGKRVTRQRQGVNGV